MRIRQVYVFASCLKKLSDILWGNSCPEQSIKSRIVMCCKHTLKKPSKTEICVCDAYYYICTSMFSSKAHMTEWMFFDNY